MICIKTEISQEICDIDDALNAIIIVTHKPTYAYIFKIIAS